jgi:phage portal protein BeeE
VRLIQRLTTKGFSRPPFWALDRPIGSTSLWGSRESIGVDFERHVYDIYCANGVVFACIAARAMVFAQARFLWKRMGGGPQDLFGNRDLALLEIPWPNGSTGDLLTLMEQDVSLAGNFYGLVVGDRAGQRIRRLRPDWVVVVSGSERYPDDRAERAFDARIIAYTYAPPGMDPITYDVSEVVHYSEFTDPLYNWRGMSWLTPVVREIQADQAATQHKLSFFRNGATPAMAIKYDPAVSREAFESFVEWFRREHEGAGKAYRTLHLGGGADIVPLTFDFKQLDFKSLQGSAEIRIAAAAGAHPVIVGLSEGLSGSSLNAGNFQASRRLFVDGRIRFLWAKAAPALESVLPVPEGCRLWYDDRDIPFLRDDAMAEAQRRQVDAAAIRQLIDAGFKPDDVVDAITAGDLRRLRHSHTGLYSVQLQPLSDGQALSEVSDASD